MYRIEGLFVHRLDKYFFFNFNNFYKHKSITIRENWKKDTDLIKS